MAFQRLSRLIRFCAAGMLTVGILAASEHHGLVKFGDLPLPGATITATQGDKKLVAVTDQQGLYSFPDLPDGIWQFQVEMLCFAPVTREVGVAPNAPSAEWELKLLPIGEMKTSAPAPAPAGPPAGTSTPASTATAATANAPAASAPSAQNDKGSNGKRPTKNAKSNGPATASTPQSGFQRADLNASAGASSIGDEASTAAPNEVQGASSEALVVSGSVSSGIERRAIGNTRKGPGPLIRGDVNSVLDSSTLNARSFSLTGQATPQPSYNNLRFGGSVGGPLIIPHISRGNGTNFFLNYQMARNRNARTQPGLMPTEAERTGDLSRSLDGFGNALQIIDPTTGFPFPGNIIPDNRISPQAKYLLGYYPLPNFAADSRYNYQLPLVNVANQDDVAGRINRTVDRNNFINWNMGYRNSRSENPSLFGFRDHNNVSGIQTGLNWRHVFNQRINGNLGLQYSRMSIRTTPFFARRKNVSGEAGITGNNQDPENWGPPTLSFSSGFSGLSDAQQSFTRNQTSGATYVLQVNRRPHTLTMGGDYRRQQFNLLSQQDPRGTFTFTGAATRGNQSGTALTGSDFADFLLGVPDTSSIAFGNADKYLRSSSWAAYFTDDWRASSGFTLNAGVRWEYSSPVTELYGRLVNLDINPGFLAVTPVLANNPTGSLTGDRYPDSLIRPDRKHGFQPRVGFAWHPFFGSSMVVRGGYGISLNTSVYQSIAMQMAQQSPFSKSLTVANTVANPLTLASGFNAVPGVLPNTFAIDPNFKVGYAQTWQLSVQRDLPSGMVGTVTYMGIKGTRAVQQFLPNTYPAGAVNPCPACPTGFVYQASNGNSTRHSGQVQLRRRFHNGFTASVNYTYSKSIDNAALGGRPGGAVVIAQNWLDLNGERGLSPFDQRHLATIQAQYSTGVGVRGGALLSGWRGAIFKGWTFITQITAGSGTPLTPLYLSAAVRGTGFTGPIRAHYTGLSVYDAPDGRNLNPLAYGPPLPGQWGDAGRNSIIGPRQFLMNGSMGRQFGDFDVRFDAVNVLNHVTFPNWNTAVSSAQFGLPNQANNMRTVQATVRLRF